MLVEIWERYGIPLAVTEAHIDATREDQLRWLLEIWQAGEEAREKGVDLRAITAWALIGSFDWNSLVTRSQGYYEPGAFDVRSAVPRATALAGLMQELAAGSPPSHPARPAADCNYAAARPRYSALHSERAILLPKLDDALYRFTAARATSQAFACTSTDIATCEP